MKGREFLAVMRLPIVEGDSFNDLDLEQREGDGAKAAAAKLWPLFTDSERWGVRMGIFPHAKTPDPMPHALTCALMEHAKAEDGAAPVTRKGPPRGRLGRLAKIAKA